MTPAVTLERKGSAKDIYHVFNREGTLRCLRFKFSDRVSVLDLGEIPNTPFPELGRLRCAISGHLFSRMCQEGFRTHYLSHDVRDGTMHVYPLDIRELCVSYEDISLGRILGIEIIDRRQVTKKLVDRVKAETLPMERLEPALDGQVLVPGVRLAVPFVECTTKYSDADRYVDDTEAATLARVPLDWLREHCFADVRRVSDFLSRIFSDAGFDRHDGKFEGAVNYASGRFTFADSLSPDEMRLVGRDGKSYDKDPVRHWYQDTHPAWYEEVLAAKREYPEDRSKWPSYPDKTPPRSIVSEVVDRYRTVARALKAI